MSSTALVAVPSPPSVIAAARGVLVKRPWSREEDNAIHVQRGGRCPSSGLESGGEGTATKAVDIYLAVRPTESGCPPSIRGGFTRLRMHHPP